MSGFALSEILGGAESESAPEGSAKARRRQAILDAAQLLLDQRGGPDFTVAELAKHAGVSRRTVFNHFPSVDDVIVQLSLDEIARALADIDMSATADSGAPDASAVFWALADALRAIDLAPLIFRIQRAMGGFDVASPKVTSRLATTFLRIEMEFSAILAVQHPDVDPLDLRIAVVSLIHGLSVIAPPWAASHPGGVDQEAVEHWDRLIGRLIDTLAAGYPRT